MVDREQKVRLRSLIDEYVLVVVTLLVLLALVGGYLTVSAYATTETRTETVQTASWESTGEFSHRATVVNGTDVYDRGETLRNRSSYFREITPRLNGTFVYTYTATGGGDLSATVTNVLVLRSVAEAETEEGDGTEYWRVESTVGFEETESLEPGESLAVPFSVNVNETAARLEAVDEQHGGTPGNKEMIVESRIRLTGTRNGQPVETTRVYRLPISTSSNVYEVGDPGTVANSGGQTEQRTVAAAPGPLRAYGGPALLVLALAGGALLGAGRRNGSLTVSERERDWLAYRSAREEFDDWITVARLPEEGRDATRIEVDTLGGLADVAIDTDRRVLEDPDRTLFVVFDGDRTYVYRPPVPADGDDPLAETGTSLGASPPGNGSDEPAGGVDGDGSGSDEPAGGDDSRPGADPTSADAGDAPVRDTE